MPEFLTIAVPILRNEALTKKTSIDHALIAFTEVKNYALPLELKVALYFMGIETLANAYWSTLRKSSRTSAFFDNTIWCELHDILEMQLEEREIEQTNQDKFLNIFRKLRDPPIREKIQLLCESNGLLNYSSQIKAINDMRNAFAHGRTTELEYGGLQIGLVAMCAERLLAKLILKSLNFYDSPAVHPSFKADDLLAE